MPEPEHIQVMSISPSAQSARLPSGGIGNSAEQARESARKKDGRFGEQVRSEPEVSLGATDAPLGVTGPERPVVFIARPYEGYVPLSMQDARIALNIPKDEPDDVVSTVVDLLSTSEDYPPYVDMQPTYADPGEESVLDTSEWADPAPGIEWGVVRAWRTADGDCEVSAAFTFDPAGVGFSAHESSAAAEIAADATVRSHHVIPGAEMGEVVELTEGRLSVDVFATFAPDEFTPRLVERKLAYAMEHNDPRKEMERLRRDGAVISNEDLRAARDIDGRAVAYAALNGRTPTDAEAVAIARDLGGPETLQRGYMAEYYRAFGGQSTADRALRVWRAGHFKAKNDAFLSDA